MIVNIFMDIWNKIIEIFNDFYNFIMKNYNEPFLWITIFGIMLLIAYVTIANLTNK